MNSTTNFCKDFLSWQIYIIKMSPNGLYSTIVTINHQWLCDKVGGGFFLLNIVLTYQEVKYERHRMLK